MHVIIGTKPPPRGGVAVYVERKIAFLNSNNVDVLWINPRNILFFTFFLFRLASSKKYALKITDVEMHTAHPIAIFLATLFGVEGRISFYDHNYSEGFCHRNKLNKLLLRRFLRRLKCILVVGEHLIKNYDELTSECNLNFDIVVPYISLKSIRADPAFLGEKCLSFFNKYKVVFINSAWFLGDDKYGEDLYGLKNSAEVFLSIYANNPFVSLLLIVGGGPKDRVDELRKISYMNSNVMLLEGNLNLTDFLRMPNAVLLRTTTTDGDSVSIREALELDRVVLASDAVPRPENTYIYELNSSSSLAESLKMIVDNFNRF